MRPLTFVSATLATSYILKKMMVSFLITMAVAISSRAIILHQQEERIKENWNQSDRKQTMMKQNTPTNGMRWLQWKWHPSSIYKNQEWLQKKTKESPNLEGIGIYLDLSQMEFSNDWINNEERDRNNAVIDEVNNDSARDNLSHCHPLQLLYEANRDLDEDNKESKIERKTNYLKSDQQGDYGTQQDYLQLTKKNNLIHIALVSRTSNILLIRLQHKLSGSAAIVE